jgi:hypothetical protein
MLKGAADRPPYSEPAPRAVPPQIDRRLTPLPILRAVETAPRCQRPPHASPHRWAPPCRPLLRPSRRPGHRVRPHPHTLTRRNHLFLLMLAPITFPSSSSEPPLAATPPCVRRAWWAPQECALSCCWLRPVDASFGCGLGRHWQALGWMLAQRCAAILISFSNWFN